MPDGQGGRVRHRAAHRRHGDARHRQRRPVGAVDAARRRPRGDGQRGATRRQGDLRAERVAAGEPARARRRRVHRAPPGADLREAPTSRRCRRARPTLGARAAVPVRRTRSARFADPHRGAAAGRQPAVVGVRRDPDLAPTARATIDDRRVARRHRRKVRAAGGARASTCRRRCPTCGSAARANRAATLRPPLDDRRHCDEHPSTSTSSPTRTSSASPRSIRSAATGEGITGHDHEMTDYSPDGVDERAEHDRATLRALAAATDVMTDADRVAAERDARATRARARGARRRRAPARPPRARQPGAGRAHGLRPDAARHRRRTGRRSPSASRSCPQGLVEHRGRVRRGRRSRASSPHGGRRSACAQQADMWGGVDGSTPPVLPHAGRRVRRVAASPTRRFRDRLEDAGDARDRGVRVARPLPRGGVRAARRPSTTRSGASATRCTRSDFNGIELDLDETYAWGWDELHRIEHAMRPGRRAHHPRRRRRRR